MRPSPGIPSATQAGPPACGTLQLQLQAAAHGATAARRWVMLHVQSNPLPICTRPRVLIKGKRT